MTIYQIVLIVISFSFLFFAFKGFIEKEKGYSFFIFLTSLIIWSPIFILSVFPNLAQIITKKLGMGENLNTLIFIGFIFVFLILFKLINKIQELEKNITELVRKDSLNNWKKKF